MIKKTIFALAIISLLLNVSCDFLKQESEGVAVAKVHDVFLFQKDIKKFNIPSGISEKDSISLLFENIDDWATKQLLMHQAEENLPHSEQEKFNTLVSNYKIDLFISAYKNLYVQKNMNTIVSENEIKNYYKNNKQSFLLKKDLFKVRYIKLPHNYKDLTATKRKFSRFNEEDQEELNQMIPGFIASNFNEEDIWQSYEDIIAQIPALTKLNKSKTLINNKTIEFSDDEGEFLLKIYKKNKTGNIAPIEFVSETIKQIILNKRKLELQQKLEKEITKDALQTKDYTIFQ